MKIISRDALAILHTVVFEWTKLHRVYVMQEGEFHLAEELVNAGLIAIINTESKRACLYPVEPLREFIHSNAIPGALRETINEYLVNQDIEVKWKGSPAYPYADSHKDRGIVKSEDKAVEEEASMTTNNTINISLAVANELARQSIVDEPNRFYTNDEVSRRLEAIKEDYSTITFSFNWKKPYSEKNHSHLHHITSLHIGPFFVGEVSNEALIMKSTVIAHNGEWRVASSIPGLLADRTGINTEVEAQACLLQQAVKYFKQMAKVEEPRLKYKAVASFWDSTNSDNDETKYFASFEEASDWGKSLRPRINYIAIYDIDVVKDRNTPMHGD